MIRGRVTVDTMSEADIADVVALQAYAFPSSDPGHASAVQLREELARPFAHLWVARDDGARVLAFLLAWLVVDELHVLNVATHPDHRRKGMARLLMDHAIGFSRAHKGRLVLLEVRRSNAAAIALYRALAFFAMGVRRAYYADGEDAVEMALLMDPETGEIKPHADEVRLDVG